MFKQALTYLGLSLLICSMVLPSGLHFGLYHYQRKQIRKTVKAHFISGLKKEETRIFNFSEVQYSKLEWDGDDEFVWQERKYDVIAQSSSADGIQIKAWLDDEESELRSRFHRLLRKNQAPPQGEDLKLIDHFKHFFFEEQSSEVAFAKCDPNFNPWQDPVSVPYLNLIGQPPNLG